MKKIWLATIAVAAMAYPANTVLAATGSGSFSVRGIGSQSCKSLVEGTGDKTGGQAVMDMLGSWIAGYLSHGNRAADGTFEVMPISDTRVVSQMVLNVCNANPETMVEPAVATIINSLKSSVQSDDTPIIEITNAGLTTQIRKGAFLLAQKRLEALGLLPSGSSDGSYGPRTRDALVAFQREKNTQATGIPDAVTLINLFVADK
jgi:hypothetical protein